MTKTELEELKDFREEKKLKNKRSSEFYYANKRKPLTNETRKKRADYHKKWRKNKRLEFLLLLELVKSLQDEVKDLTNELQEYRENKITSSLSFFKKWF